MKFVFPIISFNRLISFFKPILSFWPPHSPFVSNRITSFAKSSCSFLLMFNVVFRQFVSILTVGFPRIYGCYSNSSHNINYLSNQFKMFWITATSVATEVIHSHFSLLSRYFVFEKRIYNPMYSLCSSSIPEKSIPRLVKRACPIPTVRFIVDGNSIKNSFVFFWVHGNDKIVHINYYTTY